MKGLGKRRIVHQASAKGGTYPLEVTAARGKGSKDRDPSRISQVDRGIPGKGNNGYESGKYRASEALEPASGWGAWVA